MITAFAQQIVQLADSSSDSDAFGGVVIVALLAGGGLYFLVWNYYRNANARFKFEDHTVAQAHNVQGTDTKINHRTGLKSSTISGRNDNDATAKIPIEKLWPTPTDAITSVLDAAGGPPAGQPGHPGPQPPIQQPPQPGPQGQPGFSPQPPPGPYDPGQQPGPYPPPQQPGPYQPGQ